MTDVRTDRATDNGSRGQRFRWLNIILSVVDIDN